MSNNRFYFCLFCFFIVVSGLVYRAYVLMHDIDNVENVNLILMNRTPVSLRRLNEHVVKLDEMTNNIDNYTFSTIKNEIDKTIKLVSYTNIELKAQYDAWVSVKGAMKNDGESLFRLKEQLDATRSLQENEIIKLKKILDDVQKPSIISDTLNLALTFVLGILSSVLATMMISAWKNRTKDAK